MRSYISHPLSLFPFPPCKRHVDRQDDQTAQIESFEDPQVPYLFQNKQKNQVFQKAEKSLGYQIRSSDRREKTRLPRGGYLFWCKKKPCVLQYVQKNAVFMSSPAQCILVYALRLEILGEWIEDMCVVTSTTPHRLVMGGRGLRPCELCGGGAGLRRRRSGGRSHLRHMRMAFHQCGCTCVFAANWGG